VTNKAIGQQKTLQRRLDQSASTREQSNSKSLAVKTVPVSQTPIQDGQAFYMYKYSADGDDNSSGGESYPRDYHFSSHHGADPRDGDNVGDDYSLDFPTELLSDEDDDDDCYTFLSVMTGGATMYSGGEPIVLARDRDRKPLLYRTGSGRNLMDI
jgi:hypothetical protein